MLPREQWRIVVKDKYPAYVSWDTFEKIQSMLRDNYAEYDRNKTRGIPRVAAHPPFDLECAVRGMMRLDVTGIVGIQDWGDAAS